MFETIQDVQDAVHLFNLLATYYKIAREVWPSRPALAMLHLETVLQRLYDSEINVTITMLWDGGFDFALVSYMEWGEAGTPLDDLQSFVHLGPARLRKTPWFNCAKAEDLAEAIHRAAIEKYPESQYAKVYGRLN
jgi:hypothetical protein